MAVLYTLGFDCDQDEVAAREIAAAFNGLEFDFSQLGQANTVSGIEVFLSELGQENNRRGLEMFLSELGQANNRRGAEVFLSDLGQGKFDCKVEVASSLGEWWTVCVDFPRLAWLCNVLQRNALGTYQKIQSLIYNRVKQMSGYRSAMFGCEAHSDLSEVDWLTELDQILSGKKPHFAGLILKKSLTTGRQIETDVVDFSPGYVLYEPEPEG